MSYQSIYGELNKKASSEQIKKLASVLKGRHMVKKASAEQVKQLAHTLGMKKRAFQRIPMTGGLQKTIFKRFGVGGVNPVWKKLAIGAGLLVPTVATGTYFAGSSGKSTLNDALTRTQAYNKKLVDQNKALKDESWWEKLFKQLGEWWEKISNAWSAGKENTANTTNK